MLCYMYNNTAHAVTRVPPALLFMGRPPHTPIDALLSTHDPRARSDMVQQQLNALVKVHRIVKERHPAAMRVIKRGMTRDDRRNH